MNHYRNLRGAQTFVPSAGSASPSGLAGAPPLSAADMEFLKTRACEFVHVLANSIWMNGFQFTEKNRWEVGVLAATALTGKYASPGHGSARFTMAVEYVRANLNQSGFCYPKQSTSPMPVPTPTRP